MELEGDLEKQTRKGERRGSADPPAANELACSSNEMTKTLNLAPEIEPINEGNLINIAQAVDGMDVDQVSPGSTPAAEEPQSLAPSPDIPAGQRPPDETVSQCSSPPSQGDDPITVTGHGDTPDMEQVTMLAMEKFKQRKAENPKPWLHPNKK